MYAVSIIGYISYAKQNEFLQNMRQILAQPAKHIIHFSVAKDMMNEDQFEIKMQFLDKESMISFMGSEDYARIAGSFRVLGMLKDKRMIAYEEID